MSAELEEKGANEAWYFRLALLLGDKVLLFCLCTLGATGWLLQSVRERLSPGLLIVGALASLGMVLIAALFYHERRALEKDRREERLMAERSRDEVIIRLGTKSDDTRVLRERVTMLEGMLASAEASTNTPLLPHASTKPPNG